MGRRWLAVAATALVTAYDALVVVFRVRDLPSTDRGIAPSYGLENGQRGAQCVGDRPAHPVAGTQCRLRPAGGWRVDDGAI
jgi:hypothetical protein